jgi:hypothetical protein
MKQVRQTGMWLSMLAASTWAAANEPVSFRKEIAPILQDRCIACHGSKKAEGGYRVDSFERATKAGDSGTAAFEGGKLEESEAFRRVTSTDTGERMPLDADPLTAGQIATLRRWLEEGARFDGPDPNAELVTIIPPPTHPDPPASYSFPMPITALEFSSDGRQLLVGGYHEVTIWNPEDGKLIRRIKNVGQRTYAIDLSADDKRLAVGCGAPGRLGETRLFETETGDLKQVFGTTGDVVLDLAFSPSGERLAVAAADGIVRVFEVADGSESLTISSHSDWVAAVAWNADASRLATASRDKTAKVFDAKTGELLVTYSGHGQPVKGVAFHPENNRQQDPFVAGRRGKKERGNGFWW